VEVYKRETREIIRRFLRRQYTFQRCIASLDAALAGLIPNLQPEQLDELRIVLLTNNEKVMEEMARRGRAKRTKA
jgi:DNA repair protein RadC